MTDNTRPHDPTEEQKHNLLWMMNSEGVALCRMKHKTTGEWRTIIMVPHHRADGGIMTYPIGYMMEANEVRTSLDEYELPAMARRETEEELITRKAGYRPDTEQPVEELMDRIFPNRKKD